ncbi:hypothetical protein [Flavihumibacter sp. ZG627]|uniref:hypothetical protein n=1 Tax=Flavihumibacter sp. ZG627 TaxID=1463156 RepID=UPI0020A157CB|nr:hypothetical protein [Flavihumibacter sp. ZG627]
MATTNTYLNFNGNCEEAFNFYKSVFGGEFNYLGRFGDMPPSEDYKVPEADKNKVMHVSLPIGSSILMGSDTGGEWAPGFVKKKPIRSSTDYPTVQRSPCPWPALSGAIISGCSPISSV